MAWGIVVGVLMILLIFAFFGFIIFKETRTHRFWQQKVEEGDLEMIRQLVEVEVAHWRTERPPKGVPAAVWQGIQGVEIGEVGRDYIRASTAAESQFAMVGGERREVSTALAEAKRITAKLTERFLYDIPHVHAQRVQIDCYSTFHEVAGEIVQRCILSTLAHRDDAAEIDWDNDAPEVIAERLGARYQTDDRGSALPFEPDERSVRVSPSDAHRNGPGADLEAGG